MNKVYNKKTKIRQIESDIMHTVQQQFWINYPCSSNFALAIWFKKITQQ